jgi:hypothetical protein
VSNGVGVENISACYPRPHLSQHGEPNRSSQDGEYGAEGFSLRFWRKMPSWGCTGHGKENAELIPALSTLRSTPTYRSSLRCSSTRPRPSAAQSPHAGVAQLARKTPQLRGFRIGGP